MKKVYLLGFILAATVAHVASANAEAPVAVAPPQPGCPKAFQGFHLGGNIGYGVGWGKAKFSNQVLGSNGSSIRGVRGVDGGIGVGYTHRLCNWALGLVFDANWAGTKGNSSETHNFLSSNLKGTASSKVRLRNSLQLYARLGYVMREIAMPFIGLGWDNSQWKHTGTTTFTDATNPALNSTVSGSKSKRLNSFLWKVGVDFLATKHVVLGFDYTGTVANKVNFKKTVAGETLTGSLKPQYNKFALTAKIVY